MSQPPYPSFPQQPPYPQHVPQAPTNGMAIASLVLGVLTLLLSVVPFVNVLGLLLGLVAIGVGLGGLAHARRHRTGGVMAGFGIGTAVVGIVVSVLVTFVAGKAFFGFFEDVTGTAEIPESSGEVGEWVAMDDEDVEVRVDSLECEPSDDPDVEQECTLQFQVRNGGDTREVFGYDEVGAVVDGDYVRVALREYRGGSRTSLIVEPGETASGFGTITVRGTGDVTAIAFNTYKLETNSTTVIDVD